MLYFFKTLKRLIFWYIHMIWYNIRLSKISYRWFICLSLWCILTQAFNERYLHINCLRFPNFLGNYSTSTHFLKSKGIYNNNLWPVECDIYFLWYWEFWFLIELDACVWNEDSVSITLKSGSWLNLFKYIVS